MRAPCTQIVLILMLSALILEEAGIWTIKMLVGCTTAILGFCMYSHAKLAQTSAQPQTLIRGVPELATERTPLVASKGSTGA